MTSQIAILDANTLAAIGLKGILQTVMPSIQVDVFNGFDELDKADRDIYFHYFVSIDIFLDNRTFFVENRRKTIVLTTASGPNAMPTGFNCLCLNASEGDLIKSLLLLEQTAHAHGRNLPEVNKMKADNVLSDREIEVMSFIVRGYINKEIADRLNIALSTVITHRRNIMEKLNIKSVSALTIYAVTHGYVDIRDI